MVRARYAKITATPVPQSEPLKPEQVKNNAGGFVFALDDWKRLDRFLILGSDAPTYYQKAPALTRENAACVQRCYDADALRTVERIVEISQEGRAPKNDSAIFALSLGACHKDVHVRHHAFSALMKVCRTPPHLFQFIQNCKALGRGWGPMMIKGVRAWYDTRKPEQVAYQAIKYRAREGFTHARAVNLCKPFKAENKPVYAWIKGKELSEDARGALPSIIIAHVKAMELKDSPKAVAKLVEKYKLPWEAIPTEVSKAPEVWQAMLETDMGLTALIRNLGATTSYGVLKPLSAEVRRVVERLDDVEELKKARIHPFNVLLALATYRGGRSLAARQYGKEGLSWQPVPAIVSALEEAFYASFKTIEPSGKRTLIGIDVSASMSTSLMGSSLEVNEGAAALAMATIRSEKDWHVCAFDTGMRELPLTPKMSLEQVLKYTKDINGGGTDCSLPMVTAQHKGWKVDTFIVLTDNETWAGRIHPAAALQDYRNKTGINAKLIVVGMTSTGFTIADPTDPGMLDVVGFDSAAPAVMAEFARA